MALQPDRIYYLLQCWTNGSATSVEEQELFEWISAHENQQPVERHVNELLMQQHLVEGLPVVDWERLYAQILAKHPVEATQRIAIQEQPTQNITEPEKGAQVLQLPKHRRFAWRAAAAILLLIAGAILLWQVRQKKQADKYIAAEQKQKDVAPGREGAILTLGNGEKLMLDSFKNGMVANEAGAHIQLHDHQLKYDTGENVTVSYNTLSTPRGRQFRLLLPDGTRAWLNAASSIRYPTAFAGNDRQVQITGEVYFEVAKNAAKPFFVQIDEHTSVEVLGTSFNVNAYKDEPHVKTSLLEGSIRLRKQQKAAILKPGQQAAVRGSEIELTDNTDLQMATAWTNGKFQFYYAGVEEVLRQLARWYDIDVKYAGKVPDLEFTGSFQRSFNLSEALAVLEGLGIQFKISGNTLTVLP